MLPIFDKINESGEYCPNYKDIRQWHSILNAAVFDGVVPKFSNIEIKGHRGQFAATVQDYRKRNPEERCCHLQINPSFPTFKIFLVILAHEMIHAWEWVVNGKMTHGKTFFQWREKLAEQGIPLTKEYHRKFLDIPKHL